MNFWKRKTTTNETEYNTKNQMGELEVATD